MLRLTRVSERAADAAPADPLRLRLTYDERSRSRLAAMTDDGTAVAIVLPRGTVLRGGSLLEGEGGALALIEAAPQPLTRITAATPLQLLRVVYHLANRHVPAQISESAVQIERDPVLEKLAASLGATVEHVDAPFEPEAGAYDGGHHHGQTEAVDETSRNLGEELSIAAHRARAAQGPSK